MSGKMCIRDSVIVVFGAGVDLRHAFHHLAEGNAAAVIAHPHLCLLYTSVGEVYVFRVLENTAYVRPVAGNKLPKSGKLSARTF